MYIAVRKDQPVNMAAAFEKPVLSDAEGGFLEGSKTALAGYAQSVYGTFVDAPSYAWIIGDGMGTLGLSVSMKELLSLLPVTLDELILEGK